MSTADAPSAATLSAIAEAETKLNDAARRERSLTAKIAQLERSAATKDQELQRAIEGTSLLKTNLEKVIQDLVNRAREKEKETEQRVADAEEVARRALHEHASVKQELVRARQVAMEVGEKDRELSAITASAKNVQVELLTELESAQNRSKSAGLRIKELEEALDFAQRRDVETRKDCDDFAQRLNRADEHIVKLTEQAEDAHVEALRLRRDRDNARADLTAMTRAKEELMSRLTATVRGVAEETDKLTKDFDQLLGETAALAAAGTEEDPSGTATVRGGLSPNATSAGAHLHTARGEFLGTMSPGTNAATHIAFSPHGRRAGSVRAFVGADGGEGFSCWPSDEEVGAKSSPALGNSRTTTPERKRNSISGALAAVTPSSALALGGATPGDTAAAAASAPGGTLSGGGGLSSVAAAEFGLAMDHVSDKSAQVVLLASFRVRDALSVLIDDCSVAVRGIAEERRRKATATAAHAVKAEAFDDERQHVAALVASLADIEDRMKDEVRKREAAEQSLRESATWVSEAVTVGEERARRVEDAVSARTRIEDDLVKERQVSAAANTRADEAVKETARVTELLRAAELETKSTRRELESAIEETTHTRRLLVSARAEAEERGAAAARGRQELSQRDQFDADTNSQYRSAKRRIVELESKLQQQSEAAAAMEAKERAALEEVAALRARIDQLVADPPTDRAATGDKNAAIVGAAASTQIDQTLRGGHITAAGASSPSSMTFSANTRFDQGHHLQGLGVGGAGGLTGVGGGAGASAFSASQGQGQQPLYTSIFAPSPANAQASQSYATPLAAAHHRGAHTTPTTSGDFSSPGGGGASLPLREGGGLIDPASEDRHDESRPTAAAASRGAPAAGSSLPGIAAGSNSTTGATAASPYRAVDHASVRAAGEEQSATDKMKAWEAKIQALLTGR